MNNARTHEFTVGSEAFLFDGNTFDILNGDNEDVLPKDIIGLRESVPALRTLALTICNKCNLACSYCYASQGRWDIPGQMMSKDVAFAAIDHLFAEVKRSNASLATVFFGGEPLLRFSFIQDVAAYAKKRAQGINLRFALVTNGTLLDENVGKFLAENGFIVSLSIDGSATQHDQARFFPNGRGSYETIIAKVTPLLGHFPILIRTTISNHNANVREAVQSMCYQGFERISYELDNDISDKNFETFLCHSRIYSNGI